MKAMKKVHTGNKFRICVTIMPSINAALERLAYDKNTSKSAVVEEALKNFIGTQLENDARKLAEMQFDDVPTEEEWLALELDDNLWTWDE